MDTPETVVSPELQELQGRDEAEGRLLWHVEVINECDKPLAADWSEHTFAPLFQSPFNSVLHKGYDRV